MTARLEALAGASGTLTPRWRAPRPRRAPASAAVAIPDARVGLVERWPSAAWLALLLLGSFGLHVALAAALGSPRARQVAAFSPPIRVRVEPERLAPPPPREAPAPTPEPQVRRRVAVNRPTPAAATPTPVPTPETPPDPTPTPALEAPLLVPGVALSATSVGGTMKVGVGGSPSGKPGGAGTGAGEAKPYHASQLAEGYELTEEPTFLDNVSAADVRRFYPEAARREKLEALVRAKLLVDDDGSVVRVVIVDDPGNGFGKAAAKLARLYKFKPARVAGRAVATEILMTIHFELD